MILTKHRKQQIINEIKGYKEAGYSKKKLVIELCVRFQIPIDFAMEIYDLVMDMD